MESRINLRIVAKCISGVKKRAIAGCCGCQASNGKRIEIYFNTLSYMIARELKMKDVSFNIDAFLSDCGFTGKKRPKN